MLPYEEWTQEDFEREDAEREAALSMTDEEVRALTLREYKPGYYYNDPRYPGVDPETRYLLNHPALDYMTRRKTSEPSDAMLPRHHGDPLKRFRPKKGEPAWDEEQFMGKPTAAWTGQITSEPKRIPITSSSDRLPFTPKNPRTTTSLWLCQICRVAQAEWPHEISWQKIVWGLRFTLVVRSPYACTNCRIMHFKEQHLLGHQNHRPFWSNVIALVTGSSQTKTIGPIQWINRWRIRRQVRRTRRQHGW